MKTIAQYKEEMTGKNAGRKKTALYAIGGALLLCGAALGLYFGLPKYASSPSDVVKELEKEKNKPVQIMSTDRGEAYLSTDRGETYRADFNKQIEIPVTQYPEGLGKCKLFTTCTEGEQEIQDGKLILSSMGRGKRNVGLWMGDVWKTQHDCYGDFRFDICFEQIGEFDIGIHVYDPKEPDCTTAYDLRSTIVNGHNCDYFVLRNNDNWYKVEGEISLIRDDRSHTKHEVRRSLLELEVGKSYQVVLSCWPETHLIYEQGRWIFGEPEIIWNKNTSIRGAYIDMWIGNEKMSGIYEMNMKAQYDRPDDPDKWVWRRYKDFPGFTWQFGRYNPNSPTYVGGCFSCSPKQNHNWIQTQGKNPDGSESHVQGDALANVLWFSAGEGCIMAVDNIRYSNISMEYDKARQEKIYNQNRKK